MPRDDLLPYPLAGADPGPPPDAPDASPPGAGDRDRSRWPVTAVTLVVIVGLVLGLLALWGTHRADRAVIEELRAQLAAAEQAAEREAAGQAAEQAPGQAAGPTAERDALGAESVPAGDTFGAEMLAASAGVERYRALAEQAGSSASGPLFVRAFFGRDISTRAWNRLPDEPWPGRVLAQVDDPGAPGTIWVSRRSSRTADPKAPSRTHCLALDIGGVMESVANNRDQARSGPFDDLWPASHTSAPLRWWPDVYRFVPPDECGG